MDISSTGGRPPKPGDMDSLTAAMAMYSIVSSYIDSSAWALARWKILPSKHIRKPGIRIIGLIEME
jgi:hypothetical protein